MARSPEGKRIEGILIVSEDVVAASDPYPRPVNGIHFTTRDFIVRQELVVREGELFDGARLEESARNLRRLFILAIAQIVPVEGTDGGIALLVVTKDLWSIRLNSEYILVGNVLELLRLRPTEQNFFGLNAQLAGDLLLRLDTVSLGESLAYPRLFGTVLAVNETSAVVVNRHTQKAEGSRGGLSIGKPLYTLEDTWGFNVAAGWDVERQRIFQGPRVLQLPLPGGGTVADAYDQRTVRGSVVATRSYGMQYKTNASLGWGGYSNAFTVPLAAGGPVARSYFAASALPRSESASYLLTSLQAFEARYAVMHDVRTFALAEDHQLGYSAVATLHWADPAFASALRFVEGGASAGYTALAGGDLVSVTGAVAARWQVGARGVGLSGTFVNRRASFQVSNISPPWGIGRVVTRVLCEEKKDDLNHYPLFLGGDNGLRGTPAQDQAGTRRLLANVEYRTRPLELWTLHLGLVFFYDAGTAYDGSPSWTHVVGLGLRALFPQFDVSPIRIDFGYVVSGVRPPFSDRFSSSFGQVSDLQPAFLNQPL